MVSEFEIEVYLKGYDSKISSLALELRKILISNLPDIIEELDTSAKMIAYCYGRKYSDLICVIIPSKKGLKLGFNRGIELHDPHKLLEGKGKITRYISITSSQQITSSEVREMLLNAFHLYSSGRNNLSESNKT